MKRPKPFLRSARSADVRILVEPYAEPAVGECEFRVDGSFGISEHLAMFWAAFLDAAKEGGRVSFSLPQMLELIELLDAARILLKIPTTPGLRGEWRRLAELTGRETAKPGVADDAAGAGE